MRDFKLSTVQRPDINFPYLYCSWANAETKRHNRSINLPVFRHCYGMEEAQADRIHLQSTNRQTEKLSLSWKGNDGNGKAMMERVQPFTARWQGQVKNYLPKESLHVYNCFVVKKTKMVETLFIAKQ